jgi:hypothetical protein
MNLEQKRKDSDAEVVLKSEKAWKKTEKERTSGRKIDQLRLRAHFLLR